MLESSIAKVTLDHHHLERTHVHYTAYDGHVSQGHASSNGSHVARGHRLRSRVSNDQTVVKEL